MITALLAKLFGTKNEREIKRLRPIVHKINKLEESMMTLTDAELANQTNIFRERIAKGEHLDSLLPEAFATVREASRRTLNMRHFDVQLMGGMALHEGKIAEMKTGEGKTLVASLPLYLNALSGKGVHLITVNDYLARRDAEWNRPIFNALGLEVGIIQNDLNDEDRKKAYNADITYGTNNEFGFDYLRDNMKFKLEDCVQRELNFAIVDEVDSILIDEARTPLIISGAAEKSNNLYTVANMAVTHLKKNEDYEVDEKARSVHLTDSGTDKIERVLMIQNLYAPENILVLHHVTQALKAHALFRRDVDYVVREGEVLIVDEFTGRILPGRRYSDGLHQALEAKEGVAIERENQTLASITLQNYFRLYKKLGGMTGTASTEAGEFYSIYKLGVITIPTHKPMIRKDEIDAIFLDREDKFRVVVEDIKSCHKKGQPVLVGTIAIETSELLSALLQREGIAHNVLNAKNHAREAEIVKEAGEVGRVTIATNMAGRGTDIKLNHDSVMAGGLRIIGTERHESRRIDNQLRGRSGRQGDPGSSKFYLSLEDDLMRIFGGERLKKTMQRIGMEKGESIEHKIVSRAIENAQEKVEKHNYEIRKNLLEYDDVLNQQRKIIYGYRQDILAGEDELQSLIKDIIFEVIDRNISIYCPKATIDQTGKDEIISIVSKLIGIDSDLLIQQDFYKETSTEKFKEQLVEFLIYQYEQYRALISQELVNEAEKWILLETIDQYWKLHLQTIDRLKEGIHLRGYAQKNPLIEYKKESFSEFENMLNQIKWDIVTRIFKLRNETLTHSHIAQIERERKRELEAVSTSSPTETGAIKTQTSSTTVRKSEKVGRNEPCPCGSGKKYKQCCGKI